MNRNDYWRKREEAQLRHNLTEEAEIQKAINDRYNYMLYQVQAQINDFYARYARREQITLAEAKQRVSKMDVQAFGSKAKKYVEEKDFSAKANQELRLYNATMRINRLELLKANIGLEMIDGFNDLEHLMDNSLTKRTRDELKRQEDILRRDAGILGESISNNAKAVGSIVNASFNNATWSERIWGNQTQLRNELSSLLTQGLIQGRNPRVLAPALEKMFGVSRRNAERLMATELARVQTDAQMQTFKENDIDEYIFLSLDTACSECMALNEKHFPVKDMEPGENAPPIHPNCRCSTAAYVDREALERELFGEEAAAGEDNEISASKLPPRLAQFVPDAEERQRIIKAGIAAEKPIFADDDLGRLAQGLPPKKGVYDIVMHGHQYSVEFFGQTIDVETLCAIIAQRKDYKKGTDIRLISCYTGAREDGVANYIAKKLKVTVWAPDKQGIILKKPSGEYEVYSGSDRGKRDGSFIPFTSEDN